MLQKYSYEDLVFLPDSIGDKVVYEITLDEYDWVNEQLNGLFRTADQDIAFLIDYLGTASSTVYLKIRDRQGHMRVLEGDFDSNIYITYMTKLLELKISNLKAFNANNPGDRIVIDFYNEIVNHVNVRDEIFNEFRLEKWAYDLSILNVSDDKE
ncbi:hypothetical protein ACVRYP_03180 [Streptococcus rifensis]